MVVVLDAASAVERDSIEILDGVIAADDVVAVVDGAVVDGGNNVVVGEKKGKQ